jgi:polar amino acid transport system substrate-binding protein
MMRILIVILLFAFFNNAIAEKKVLKWAADAESGAPFVFQDPRLPSKMIGFEVDIIKAIAEELGYENLEFIQNSWDGLIPGLERKDYDLAINGLEITPDRAQVVNFSEAYFITYEVLAVRAGDESIKDLSDLIGRKAGTLKGSLAERILRDVGGINVKTYESESNSYADLRNKRIDAVLIDHPVALYYASWNPDIKILDKKFGEVIYGIVSHKDNDELIKEVNSAISKLATTGKLREIYDKWNIWNDDMARHFNDYSITKTDASGFKSFIKFQEREITWKEKIERYLVSLPDLGAGALTTLYLSILAMILAVLLGLILAILKVYGPRPVSIISTTYIEIVRGTPLLIQLYLIYYGLPQIGINISPLIAGVLGLGLNYAAYEAENYRAGLFSVPRGQLEAAISLGMSRYQALRHIIVPQAIRLVIPPVTNDFISLLKDSSLVSVITMVELTKEYGRLASTYYDHIGLGLIVAIIYLLLGLPFVKLSKIVENKFSLNKKTSKK